MSIFKKFTAVALSAALFAAPLPEINSASAASGIYVKYRTADEIAEYMSCLLYTSPSPRDCS